METILLASVLMLLEMLISFALFGTEHQYFSIYSRYLGMSELTTQQVSISMTSPF